MNLNGKTLLYGFVAGALSVIVFHQGMVLVLWLLGYAQNVPWNVRGTVPPFGVPVLLNQMFWGGLWGIGYAALGHWIPVAPIALRGAVYGLLGPFLLGGGILVPLIRRSGAFVWQWPAPRWIIGALIAASFGAGVALILNALGRR
jgi:hypothetical protein